MLSQKLIDFYLHLQPPPGLPAGVEVLFPHEKKEVQLIIKTFFNQYFNDDHKRGLIFGINPGRYGAGITGINFTAPKQLKINCGIQHAFNESSELSAEFIYEMIDVYGGPAKFYSDWFITPVCQLGFVKDGKNMNYYDAGDLLTAVTPYIVKNMETLLEIGFRQQHCVCIGEDKNYKFLQRLNEQYKWFATITPLAHPRFIMQYRRKEKERYINLYISALLHNKA